MKKVKNFLSKNKILGATTLTALMASSAQAAITFDETTGFSGSVDLIYFYSAAGAVVVALAAMWSVKKGIAFFK